MNKIKKYISNPKLIILALINIGLLDFLPDRIFLQIKYRISMGKKLNLNNPKTFNEKLQWLKLYDRKDIYTSMVDKYEMKKYVTKIIGSEYVVPIIGEWDNPNEIDFDILPNKFVLKCNHNSGTGMFVCQNKLEINKNRIIKNLKIGLKENYYLKHREWPYKNVKRKIIAEKFLETEDECLVDYKFFCFEGKPKIMYISHDYSKSPTTDFYDMEFKKLNLKMKDNNSNKTIDKPECFEKMIELAKKLSKNTHFLRVDFYYANNQIYVGELTFYHNAGFCNISPKIWNEKLGSWIKL